MNKGGDQQWKSSQSTGRRVLLFLSLSLSLSLSHTHTHTHPKEKSLSVLSKCLGFYTSSLRQSASLRCLCRPPISFCQEALSSLPPGLEDSRGLFSVLQPRLSPLPSLPSLGCSGLAGGLARDEADKGPLVTSFQHLLFSPFAQTHPVSWSI